jgi:hypothetical protein
MKTTEQDWETGARDTLITSGAIRPCPEHFDIYVGTHDKQAERAAYAIGTNMLKAGAVREGPREEFMSLIAAALDQTPETCFICDAAYERGD